ncbi:MAG: prefoldin subunit beta [Candidatus Thermoplasmatota archaeon]|jgi:prefoldin beta subunit|nr:prefoldin subunit beta [Candidatus Thermoplasmatota archaeon]
MAIPAKLQNDIKVYQRLQQELGAIGQQRAQFELKLRETSRTLEEIQGLPEETPMYRTVGGLLVKAKSKKDVVDLLSDEKETLEVRIKAVERQENHLRERYESMQKELTEAIQAAGLAESASPKGKE